MHARGAGTHHDAGQVLLADRRGDLRLADLGAHVLIIFRVHDARLEPDHLHDLLHVDRGCDVAAAVADKNSYSLHAITSCIF